MSEILKSLKKGMKSESEASYDVEKEEMSYSDYLSLVIEKPNLLRTANQFMFDMIMSDGTVEIKGKTHYNFFDDPHNNGKEAIFGMDKTLEATVGFFSNAAKLLGSEKRVLLFKGPVGSAKSSITKLLKNGMERYSREHEDGKLYSFYWKVGESDKKDEIRNIFGLVNEYETTFSSPMNEQPLKLLPFKIFKKFLKDLDPSNNEKFNHHEVLVNPRMCPADKKIYDELVELYSGDWEKVLNEHVVVKRLVFDEQQRVGIGSFQPKDEKNQDSTELNGDINYSKIALFGSDSDPRAFNFDGEFNIANRGMIEFVEMLKLDVAFLYDLLGASQEQMIKPKKFTQTPIDEVIIGHTNEPEFKKLENNPFMEALRNRTIKIEVPYILTLKNEEMIYEKMFKKYSKRIHIAPHTFKAASMYSILTRLKEPQNSHLSLVDKMYVYDGVVREHTSEDEIEKLQNEHTDEGSTGISPRTIQDQVGNAMIESESLGYVSPMMVLNKLEDNIRENPLCSSNKKMQEEFRTALNSARQETTKLIMQDVLRSSILEDKKIEAMYENYIEGVAAYIKRDKVKNKYTGKMEEINEKFLSSIEEKIDVPPSAKDEFRKQLIVGIGTQQINKGTDVNYKTNHKLYKALCRQFIMDNKNNLHLRTSTSEMESDDNNKAKDAIVNNLVNKLGYNQASAVEAINIATSIMNKSESNADFDLDLDKMI